MNKLADQATICAISTAPGMGAIALIRVSGSDAISIVNQVFSKDLNRADSHSASFGLIQKDGKTIDEVVAVIFKGPNSFTGEDTIELNCHGSVFIQQEILGLLLSKGCRLAEPGEFTLRGFMNGKMDLSQAEAVADLIASESEGAHALAMHQMRGGFSKDIGILRDKLIHFASMIELELDFAEEDVEFANRDHLENLILEIQGVLSRLINSFATGNVIKNGVPVAILGAPNRGKSTLLNALLNEERAIVSAIAGTTRDTIEDEINIDGIQFRFIDTAGLRETADEIEHEGINRAMIKARAAKSILFLLDCHTLSAWQEEVSSFLNQLSADSISVSLVANKIDSHAGNWQDVQLELDRLQATHPQVKSGIVISALEKTNIEALKKMLFDQVNLGNINTSSTIVTNVRHFEALNNAQSSLTEVLTGLKNGITGDFLAIDIRQSLHHLGSITGEITSDDLLGNIFGKFCIGK